MTMADLSIVVLVLLFLGTLLRGFNLGMGAFAAAFLVGLAAGMPADEVTAFFPGDFFVLIVGVTALFSVAQLNGTLDWILESLLRLVGGRAALLAVVPFLVGAVLTAFGTLPAAAIAVMAPIAMGFSARYRLPALMMAVVGLMGVISGLLSPIAVFGVTVTQQAETLGLGLPSSASVILFAVSILAGVLVCVAALVVARTAGWLPRGRVTTVGAVGEGAVTSGDLGSERPSARVLVVTLGGILVVLVLAVGFGVDIGYVGLTVACVQMLVLGTAPADSVRRMPWDIVLLIGGLLTYIGLMQELGAFTRISELLTVEGSALLTLLVLCYIAAITSFAASSIAVLMTMLPLLPGVVEAGVSSLSAVLAIVLSAVVVDINPLGITGGLILGATEEGTRPRLFKQLLVYGLASVVVGPLVVWGVVGWW